MRVLIVDDDDDSREVLAELVRMLGHHPITAETADEALSSVEVHRPNLGILDISLSEMDGCELIRRIRTQLAGSRMRFVALTGHSDPATRAAAQRAGFDEFCLKPIDIESLKSLIDQENERFFGSGLNA